MIEAIQSRYRILEKIGAGGMGIVFRAEDVTLNRTVALKFLPESAGGKPDVRARFIREARAAAALNHPAICTIYEVREVDQESNAILPGTEHVFPPGTPFIAMELVEGSTLRERIELGSLPLSETLRIAIQVADGLAIAHRHRITHRDLKPENVMVTPEGRVKVLDFGLAKLVVEEADAEGPTAAPAGDADETITLGTTARGEVLGSAAYMSPEQARGLPIDTRSDIFSFGVILYEMVTGIRPFHGPTRMDTISAVMRDPPRPVDELNPSTPPALAHIIHRCLEKDRERRYPTADDLREDLERSASDSRASVTARAPRRRRPAVTLALALLVLAAGAALFFVPRLLPDRTSGPPAGSRAVIRSLAVLPLANLSGDPEQDYFADGMTDLLIADLAQIGALRVISRTSVMKYRDERKSLPEIARELRVDAVVEGSVVRVGDRVRITAQLVHAPTDTHLWASTFERSMRDVLGIQSEVARAIAREIRITLTPQESARLGAAATVDPEAQEAYLKGRYWWNKRTEEGFRRGIGFFEQAIEEDPAYARGHAGLALSYDLLGFYNYMPAGEAFKKAIDAATKAIAMDESLGEAHAALAYARLYAFWDWQGAGAEFRRAIELDPGDATLRHWQALYLAYTGRTDAAIDEIRRARDLDPLSLAINAAVGWIYYFARDYPDAERHSRRALELDPNLSLALWVLSGTQVQTGRFDEALEILERMGGGAPYAPDAIRAIAAGDRSRALGVLESLGRDPERSHITAYTLATHYALLRESDLAFHWLERALEGRERWLVYLKAEPVFDSIRDDPRFARLLQQVGFPP